MRSSLLCLKRVVCIGSLFLLSHCAKVAERSMHAAPDLASPYTLPAAEYLARSKNETGVEKQASLIMTAGRLIDDNQWQQGRLILAQTRALSGELADKKNLLLAKIDLIRDQPQSAISKLAKIRQAEHLSLYYQTQYHEILARAYHLTGKSSESVLERIKLGKLLTAKKAKQQNFEALWLAMASLPSAELNTMAVEAEEGNDLQGWLRLAQLSRSDSTQPQLMLTALQRWQKDFPNHPAQSLLPTANKVSRLFSPPKKMALLLPLTGPLAGPGLAIRDGFMAAHAQAENENLNIQFYNTDNNNVSHLYHQALADGADFIIGPLAKAEVAKVARMNHPVPTLLLNDINGEPKTNTYQFGLSPSNEAQQVALKARHHGYARALIIAPADAWGDEVAAAFKGQWQREGGVISAVLRYQADDDLNIAMRQFLQISDSEVRTKALKQVLGRKVEGIPSRRQDFDMVFLLAYPSKARQIMPLLKYYYAGDIPVYATSSVYAGVPNPMKDRDLDGLIFCDMPWVFAQQTGSKSWPERFNSYNRLYALGMDSYALSTQLNQLLLFPALGVHDKSGVLYLTENSQVARVPVWGQFKRGLAYLDADRLG